MGRSKKEGTSEPEVVVFFDVRSRCWWWHVCEQGKQPEQPYGPFVKRDEAFSHAKRTTQS